jgi:prophage DNA circulation protein
MSWRDSLRPASWRGLPFDVQHYDGKFGRRVVVHEYAFRDPVWVEDMGRGMRRLNLVGYIVGDDVADQQDRMIKAAETAGSGELMHPTLGLLQVNLIDFTPSARLELGRVIELAFVFIEGGERVFPASGMATGDLLQSAADALEGASTGDFISSVQGAVAGGTAAIVQAQTTLRGWTSTAQRLVGGSANAINSVGSLIPGFNNRFGRYLTGARSPLAQLAASTNTVTGKLSQLSRARAAVTQGTSDVRSLMSKLF